MYKIGYINDWYNKEYSSYKINEIYNSIKEIINKYNLNIETSLIDDYTKEECDLIIYEALGVNFKKMRNCTYFNEAKGNPKWLLFDFGEPHNFGAWELFNESIYRSLSIYTYFNNGYSISNYKSTETNFMFPSVLKWGMIDDLNEKYKNGTLNNKRNIKKKNFCSMCFSHPTKERYIFFDYIKDNYKLIRSFGKFKHNMGNMYYSDKSLNNIMPTYKFNICFENLMSDYDECYVTEKIVNAFKWGTIPIYWGENNYIYKFLNKDSFINLTKLSLKESLEIIKEIDNNDKLYNDMLFCNPINENFDFDKLKNEYEQFIMKILLS